MKSFVLVSALLFSLPLCVLAGPNKADWSNIISLQSGKRIIVRLYDADTPKKNRSIKGYFDSANSEYMVIIQNNGESISISRKSIRQVSVPRKTRNRVVAAVLVGGIGAAVNFAVLPLIPSGDWPEGYLRNNLFTTVPLAVIAAFAESKTVIYAMPSKNGSS